MQLVLVIFQYEEASNSYNMVTKFLFCYFTIWMPRAIIPFTPHLHTPDYSLNGQTSISKSLLCKNANILTIFSVVSYSHYLVSWYNVHCNPFNGSNTDNSIWYWQWKTKYVSIAQKYIFVSALDTTPFAFHEVIQVTSTVKCVKITALKATTC